MIPAPPPRVTLSGVLGVARAPFLPLAALVAADGALAQTAGRPDPWRLALGVLGLTAAHAPVNTLNELADDARGADPGLVARRLAGALSAAAARASGRPPWAGRRQAAPLSRAPRTASWSP